MGLWSEKNDDLYFGDKRLDSPGLRSSHAVLGEEKVVCFSLLSRSGEMSVRRSRSHRSLRPVTMISILLFVNIAETTAEDDAFNAEVCTEILTTRNKLCGVYLYILSCEILFGYVLLWSSRIGKVLSFRFGLVVNSSNLRKLGN